MGKRDRGEGEGPDALEAKLERARALINVGRWPEAVGHLHAALAADPESYWAHTMLVLCHRRLGQFDEAFKAARKAVAADPDGPEALFQLSLTHLNKGRPATAMKYARKTLELAPEWANAWRAVALCHLELKEWEKAIEHSQEDLQLADDPVTPLIHISIACDGLGDLEAAEEWVRRALEEDPTSVDALNNLALILKKQGRWQESLELFNGAITLAPANATLRANLVGTSREYLRYSADHEKPDGTPLSQEERARANERLGCWMIVVGLAAVVGAVVFTPSLFWAVLLLIALALFVGFPLLILHSIWEERHARRRLPAQARRALGLARPERERCR